jgi:hypothetical protein
MSRDQLSQPSTGRRFPMEVRELLKRVEELGFAVHTYHRRLPILMENCHAEADRGNQLCSLLRMSYLAVFSLPDDVNPELAKLALNRALDSLAEIDRGPRLSVNDQQFVVYRAFLAPLGAVSITEHVVSGVSRSYLKHRQASQLSKANRSTKGQREVARLSVA